MNSPSFPGYYFLAVDFVCVYHLQPFDKCCSQTNFILPLFLWLECRGSSWFWNAFIRCVIGFTAEQGRYALLMQVCTQAKKEGSIFRLYPGQSQLWDQWQNIFPLHIVMPQAETVAQRNSSVCTEQLWKGRSGIRIVARLSGEQRNWNVLGFHGRRTQSRASWEERSPGMSCSWFYLTLTLQKEDGGEGSLS